MGTGSADESFDLGSLDYVQAGYLQEILVKVRTEVDPDFASTLDKPLDTIATLRQGNTERAWMQDHKFDFYASPAPEQSDPMDMAS